MKMFPWTAVFSLEPKVPGQRTTDELVTNTLMLELGAMVKRSERIRLERISQGRRRRSSSTVDYSWLAATTNPPPYELTPNDLLELQELCAKVPPSQCGPVIVRFRRMVMQIQPEVHEVARLFRTVLRDCVDELSRASGGGGSGGGDDDEVGAHVTAAHAQHQRSKSLTFVNFRSKFCSSHFFKGGALGGSRSNLQQQVVEWSDEEEEDEAEGEEEAALKARALRKGRSRSMPEITPLEQSAQG